MRNRNLRICHYNELTDPGSYSFSFDIENEALGGFLVRQGEKLSAYINCCPHTGVELDWQPNQFLDVRGEFIQCSLHGALFRIDDGLCVHGPCLGQSLQALDTVIESGYVCLVQERVE